MTGQLSAPTIRRDRCGPVVEDYYRLRPTSADGSVIPDPRERLTVSAEEAFAELGVNRTTGYKAIRDGSFPVPVFRVGRSIRVPTMALRRLLELDERDGGAGSASAKKGVG
jgi:predicted DNA-binding transcriptional regulator AlpA